ncbi:AMP-binding protein [Pacificimonas sp. WHA3]|uniref:AMP-binding protein n=1 Tax=Pacificimonas pallii TaxID=2827236 RepID=A0ABS6SBP4_9SPHN|nr:AMP-binding protein [Pacificimonas pallii]MBV7255331.1 AMP-binding protein [Pacificimonas pallii]
MNKLSYVHGAVDEPLIYSTIGSLLDKVAQTHGDREAVVMLHQDWRMTYAELADAADAIAANLLDLGLRPGDRVGIWSHNRMEWLLTQYATAKAGLILVTINPAYRKSELAYALAKVGCRALILADRFKTSDYHAMILDLVPELADAASGPLQAQAFPELKFVIALGETQPPGFIPFAHLQRIPTEQARHSLADITRDLQPDDPVNIQFTSGTTGNPKGATLTHFNIVNNGYFTAKTQAFGAEDRVCVPVPLYHCFGMVLANLACLPAAAAAIFPSESFEPEATLLALQHEGCTALYGVPAMFTALIEAAEGSDMDVSNLRTGIMAGSPCPIELMKRVIADFGLTDITIGYGMTETSPLSFQSALDDTLDRRVSTVGRVHPHVEVRVADDDGRTVETGVEGEILTRGYSVMLGYWDDPEKTSEAIDRHGWMHTGDLGTIDAHGYCQIVGRKKDMIIRGGENISPTEIENHLYKHPDISEAAIFGIPDERLGEIVACWVIPKPGSELTPERVVEFCKDHIAHYKVPARVRLVEDLPRTVTGKIKKFEMRDSEIARSR